MEPNDLAPTAPDDLVGNQDPVIQALIAGGYPVRAPVQAPADGPVTSPAQVPPQPVAPPPSTPATAPPIAAYVPPAPMPSPRSGDVAGATREQNAELDRATGAIASSELAKADALAAHADTRAKIYEGHAQAQQLVDEQYQRAREKARMDANAETAAWMRDLDKKVAEEPVPGRWWANQSKFGQVMYLLSLSFGAMAQSKNPNLRNIALDMITKETEADMAEQRDKLRRQVETMKLKGQIIDQRLQAQLADSRDDHTLLASRLAIVQQAAMERANAPGPADQRAAMAEAAKWAGEQRFNIAGERANKAYSEREGQLNRDAEMARAHMTDKRERDITAATLQKDYDLAKIQAGVKLSAKDNKKFEKTRVLPPQITGIKVVDATTGAPVPTAISPTGGLVVGETVEKEAMQDSVRAQEHYALLQRVSKALESDDDLAVILKRNTQLVSDLTQLGYQQAKENDPRGIVTDKDFTSGSESALGGDLVSLKGRIASGTFSAGQGKLKEVVDKALRDMPERTSRRLGTLLDASIPGYEGNVRVDWTPKPMEIDKPENANKQQIDASYGIKSAVEPPHNLDDLRRAQALEKKGVQALPPYQPGSQDKVAKALEDFKGATPETIEERGRRVTDELQASGDRRAVLEVEQAKFDEMNKAKARVGDVERALHIMTRTDAALEGRKYLENEESRIESRLSGTQRGALYRHEVPVQVVVDLAKAHGITQLSGQDVLDIIKKTGLKPAAE